MTAIRRGHGETITTVPDIDEDLWIEGRAVTIPIPSMARGYVGVEFAMCLDCPEANERHLVASTSDEVSNAEFIEEIKSSKARSELVASSPPSGRAR